VAFTTWSAAMLPPAPGLFSTITGWPSAFESGSAMVRATRSGVEPPGNPTRMRTGLTGHGAAGEAACCAIATVDKSAAAASRTARRFGGFFMRETSLGGARMGNLSSYRATRRSEIQGADHLSRVRRHRVHGVEQPSQAAFGIEIPVGQQRDADVELQGRPRWQRFVFPQAARDHLLGAAERILRGRRT